MNGAEALIATLVQSDIELCLANPGTSEMQLVGAIDRIPGLRPVLALDEGVVTGAAEGYARMALKPACTLLHLGPGLANGLANLHNARKALSPVVNVVGDHATYHLGFDAPLTADIEGIARPVSHWVKTSTSAATLAADGAQAVAVAGGVPGKVATLIAPADAAWTELPAGFILPARVKPVPLPQVDDAALRDVVTAIRAAKNPMLLLGGAALSGEALLIAGRIAAHCGLRLHAETFNRRIARGAGRLPLVPLPYRGEFALELMADVDLMVLVGARRPVAFFAYPDKPSVLVPPGCAVHAFAAPTDDVPQALAALAEALGASHAPPVLQALNLPALVDGKLDAQGIAAAVARHLPDNAVLVDESITGSQAAQAMSIGSAPHDYLQLCGGSIGLGLPLAVGAALGAPGRKVLCLEGDGSSMYTLQSLWTMARERLDVVVVIYANRSYAILNFEFDRVGGGTQGPRARSMLDIGDPTLDFVALAKGMGVNAGRAQTAKELDALLAVMICEPGPHLIEAVMG